MSSDLERQSIEQAARLVERASAAQRTVATFSQEKIDDIVGAMARAALEESARLGEMAHLETGFGNAADKAAKNRFSAETIYNFIRPIRTVGVIRETDSIIEVAAPRGVIAAIIPSTNPTSTAIFKILISIKARNAVVLSPHPSAAGCIAETARIMAEAGQASGLPADAIGCMSVATNEGTQELMKHKLTALILATGGIGLVRAAYSSGKPAFGVGPGNVPALIERSADVKKAVKDILTGKCFDNGTICSSEQAVVVDRSIATAVREAFATEGGHFLNKQEQDKLVAVVATSTGSLNAKIVGKSPQVIAGMAGISIPPNTRAMLCELDGVGRDFPLSMEKLSPILAFYIAENLEEGCERAAQVLRFGGMGHTASIHTRDRNAAREYGVRMPASRIIVSSPSTHGAIGFTTGLEPSMTLGCGSWGGNVTSDNISPRHLIDIKRIAFEINPINKPESARPSVAASSAGASLPAPEVDRAAIANLVDRFLAERRPQPDRRAESSATGQHFHGKAGQSASAAGELSENCGCNVEPPSAAPKTDAAKPSLISKVNGRVYDFVCEEDVKQALKSKEKILVNSKTIITPAARDLGEEHQIFGRQ